MLLFIKKGRVTLKWEGLIDATLIQESELEECEESARTAHHTVGCSKRIQPQSCDVPAMRSNHEETSDRPDCDHSSS